MILSSPPIKWLQFIYIVSTRYSATCCGRCSTSKFKFSVCAKEVWIKALLIPGEQMQAARLMLMPSYQGKMAEPSCKQRHQRYVFVCDVTEEKIMINGLFWIVGWWNCLWYQSRGGEQSQPKPWKGWDRETPPRKKSTTGCITKAYQIHNITSAVHCEVMWWLPSE